MKEEEGKQTEKKNPSYIVASILHGFDPGLSVSRLIQHARIRQSVKRNKKTIVKSFDGMFGNIRKAAAAAEGKHPKRSRMLTVVHASESN